jgi:hypothetical protein
LENQVSQRKAKKPMYARREELSLISLSDVKVVRLATEKIEEQFLGGGFLVAVESWHLVQLFMASAHLEMKTSFRGVSAIFEDPSACTRDWRTETVFLSVAVVLER